MPRARIVRAVVALGLAFVCFAPPVLFLVAHYYVTIGVNRRGMIVLAVFAVAGTLLACWGMGVFARRPATSDPTR